MSARVPFRFSTILSILLALMLVTAGCLKSPDEKYADYMASGMLFVAGEVRQDGAHRIILTRHRIPAEWPVSDHPPGATGTGR